MNQDDRHRPDLAPIAEALVVAMDRVIARAEGRTSLRSLPTGFVDLDEVTGGLHPGSLVVLAGRPAMGKTGLALNVCEHLICDRGKAVMYASLGMSRVALMERLLASRSGVDGYKVRTGRGMSPDDLARLGRAYNELHAASFWISTPPAATVHRIAADARWLREHRGLDLVVVDDLRSIEPENPHDPRRQQLGLAAFQLQDLARELDIPVLVLAGAARRVERRTGHRPRVRDVEGSMAVAGAADVVLLLHRPEYYDPEDEPGVAEGIVAKNNAGHTGRARLSFRRDLIRFGNHPGDPEPGDLDGVPF